MKPLLILLALFIFLPRHSFSQFTAPPNQLSLRLSLHKFPDASPLIQFNLFGERYWSSLSYGLDYTRHLRGRHSLGLGLTVVYIYYLRSDQYPLPDGDAIKRTGFVFELPYKWMAFSNEHHRLQLIAGLNWRVMQEFYLRFYGNIDVVAIGIGQNDPGISLGLEYQFFPHPRFFIPVAVSGTQYFGNYEEEIDWALPAVIHPSMRYLKLQLGAGLTF